MKEFDILSILESILTGLDIPSAARTFIEIVALGIIVKQKYDTEKIKDKTEKLVNETAEIGKQTASINKDTIEIINKTENIGKLTSQIEHRTASITEETQKIIHNSENINHQTAQIKNETENLFKETAKLEHKRIQRETDLAEYLDNKTETISNRIVRGLVTDSRWMDRLLEESGANNAVSIFGKRISHFSYEKKALARKVIDVLELEIKINKEKKYCLLVDSGTTTYYIFLEICERIKKLISDEQTEDLKIWTERVFIITNNIPGIQHLMKHCNTGSSEHLDLLIKCLLIPGEPLPEYVAVTGPEAINFLEENNIKPIIYRKLGVKDTNLKIISFLSANYMVRHSYKDLNIKDIYRPVARRGGHFEIKTAFINLSDEIYMIAPLTKFSFATCEQLNHLNGFTIDEIKNPAQAKKEPRKVMYREVELLSNDNREKCTFFVTERDGNDIFCKFSAALQEELVDSYGKTKVHIANEFKLEQCISVKRDNDNYRELEIKREIPHESLKDAYDIMTKTGSGEFIWDRSWIARPRELPTPYEYELIQLTESITCGAR